MKRLDAFGWGVVLLGCVIFAIFLSVIVTHLPASEPVLHSGQSATGSPEMHESLYAIDEGGRNPDKAWAEKEVADAQEAVDKADGIINWFLGNASTAMDSRLPPFIAERDDAVRILDSAKGDLEMGNYSLARSKAEVADRKASGSYYNATVRRVQYGRTGSFFKNRQHNFQKRFIFFNIFRKNPCRQIFMNKKN